MNGAQPIHASKQVLNARAAAVPMRCCGIYDRSRRKTRRREFVRSPMEYHLLLPSEAATLIGTSKETIESLIREGKLGAFRDAGDWWIPLQCLSTYVGDDLTVEAACALAQLVQRDGTFYHTFAEPPEAAERIEGASFEPGSVGVCLQQALRMYRRSDAARGGAHHQTPRQDAPAQRKQGRG
jgi:excisionase family DNA binding protein